MAKHSKTLKTVAGFLKSVLHRRVPFLNEGKHIEDIYNYLLIDGHFATSGQPSEAQFRLIKKAGYSSVINLAPTSVFENSVVDEAAVLADLGLLYTHIPVDFKNPKKADFAAFVKAVDAAANENLWVHCAANMRVSAFVYKYRSQVLLEDEKTAATDLKRIWEPVGVWSRFVKKQPVLEEA